MPVGISSPARNLFLLGSTGDVVVTNFFKAVDLSASSDGVFLPETIKYRYSDDSYTLSGSASNSQSKGFGWIENRTYNGETGGSSQVWNARIESTVSTENTVLRDMIFDQGGNVIAVGRSNDVPWIQKYSSAGVLDWQATSNTGGLVYTGVISDGTHYYACGHTGSGQDGTSIAYVEKYDASGNPGWGKAAQISQGDVVLSSIGIADDGNILAVGSVDDDASSEGYIVKLDSNTGAILWDKSVNSPKLYNPLITVNEPVIFEKIFVDGNGQFYVVGRILSATGAVTTRGCLIKFDPEGNIIWQKETGFDATKLVEFFDVNAETGTEQVIVLGRYYDGVTNNWAGLLSKYTKNGTLLWRRTIRSSRDNSDTFSNTSWPPALDADSSFYYFLFFDEPINGASGEPDRYTFGKVSSSGNGLGAFQYNDSTGETIDYEIVSDIPNDIGILQDGSVTNSISDLISTPYSATKLMFDDYATNIAGKKRQIADKDLFSYSGSPAIRPADFQELNLLGENNFVGPELITNGTFDTDTNGWSSGNGAILTVESNALKIANNGTQISGFATQAITTVPGEQYTVAFEVVDDTSSQAWLRVGNNFGWVDIVNQNNNVTGTYETTFTAEGTLTYITFMVTVGNATRYTIVDNISVKQYKWLDTSGKGNDGGVSGATHNANGYWEFAGTDNHIISGPKCNTLFEDGGSGTIEMWVRPQLAAARQTLCSGYMTTGSTQPDRWDFEIRNNNRLGGGSHDNGFFSGTTDLSTNTWYHFVFTLDKSSGSGTLKAYINAAEEVTQNFTLDRDWATDVEFGIGNRYLQQSDFPLNADVGEVRIYPKALTAAQVVQNYNATKSKYINEAPDTAPKISSDGIVIDSNLLLNYDFGNRATYDTAHNLYDNSTNYGSSNWNLQGPNGVTTNTTDVLSPVGDYTATKWQPTTTTSQYIYDGIGAMGTETHTMSVWVRAADGETTTFGMNLYAPTQQPSDFTATDEWQRFTWTFTPQNQSTAYPVIVRELDKALYIWGPQIEKASTAGHYVPTYSTSVGLPTTVKNLSGTSIDGTINIAPFNSGGWFEFDGGPDSGTRIAFNSSTIDLSGSFSIDMWFRQGAQTADYWMLLGAQGYGDPGSNGIGHYLFADTIRTWAQDTTGTNTTLNLWDSDGTVNFTAGVWYNLILTREVGTAWRWYLNGSLVNSNTTQFLSVDFTTPNTYIGDHYNDTSWQYDGDIAALRMYSKALTAAEALQNFNATRGKYGV